MEQLKFYDNGVNTNNNKIIRALSGAFGFGRNFRDLYEFLAKHYRPGDEFYFFGLRRAAATVRAVTGFIDVCGLVDLEKFPEVKGDPIGTDLLIWDIFRLYERRLSNPEKAAEFKKTRR
ncbi:MAG: phospholipase effector Tle1 domain-containing protein [Gammaproteobacteria bacterium]